MEAQIHTIHQNDQKYRLKRDQETPRNNRTIPRRFGKSNQAFIHLGTGKISYNGDDMRRWRQKPKQNGNKSTLFAVPVTFHNGAKKVPDQRQVFLKNPRRNRNS